MSTKKLPPVPLGKGLHWHTNWHTFSAVQYLLSSADSCFNVDFHLQGRQSPDSCFNVDFHVPGRRSQNGFLGFPQWWKWCKPWSSNLLTKSVVQCRIVGSRLQMLMALIWYKIFTVKLSPHTIICSYFSFLMQSSSIIFRAYRTVSLLSASSGMSSR